MRTGVPGRGDLPGGRAPGQVERLRRDQLRVPRSREDQRARRHVRDRAQRSERAASSRRSSLRHRRFAGVPRSTFVPALLHLRAVTVGAALVETRAVSLPSAPHPPRPRVRSRSPRVALAFVSEKLFVVSKRHRVTLSSLPRPVAAGLVSAPSVTRMCASRRPSRRQSHRLQARRSFDGANGCPVSGWVGVCSRARPAACLCVSG